LNQIITDATDDLSTPLGQHVKRKPSWLRYRLPFTLRQMLAVLLGLVLLTFLGYAIFNDDPRGGEQMAKVGLKPDAAKTADSNTTLPTPPPVAERKTVTIIDGSSGAWRDVTVPSSDTSEPRPSLGTPLALPRANNDHAGASR
jgi:hypothetical protein